MISYIISQFLKIRFYLITSFIKTGELPTGSIPPVWNPIIWAAQQMGDEYVPYNPDGVTFYRGSISLSASMDYISGIMDSQPTAYKKVSAWIAFSGVAGMRGEFWAVDHVEPQNYGTDDKILPEYDFEFMGEDHAIDCTVHWGKDYDNEKRQTKNNRILGGRYFKPKHFIHKYTLDFSNPRRVIFRIDDIAVKYERRGGAVSTTLKDFIISCTREPGYVGRNNSMHVYGYERI